MCRDHSCNQFGGQSDVLSNYHLSFVLVVQAQHTDAKTMIFSTWFTIITHSTVLIHVHGKICSAQVLLSKTFVEVGMHRIMCMTALGYVALYR